MDLGKIHRNLLLLLPLLLPLTKPPWEGQTELLKLGGISRGEEGLLQRGGEREAA